MYIITGRGLQDVYYYSVGSSNCNSSSIQRQHVDFYCAYTDSFIGYHDGTMVHVCRKLVHINKKKTIWVFGGVIDRNN